MSLANLFKVTYASGLVQHIRDDAANAEAMIAKMSGLTVEKAKEFGLTVEHLVGMDHIDGIPLAVPASTSDVGTTLPTPPPFQPPAVPDPAAMPPTADLQPHGTSQAAHDVAAKAQGLVSSITAQAEARYNALRAAAAAAVAKVTGSSN